MRLLALFLLCAPLPLVCAQATGQTLTPPVQAGQVWTLSATTAEGERFETPLRLAAQPPTGTPATYRADRGVLILDVEKASLVALDLQDAREGGLGLACVVTGTLDGPGLTGLLAAGTLEQLPARLEAALALANAAMTPQEREEARRELGLGSCVLKRRP